MLKKEKQEKTQQTFKKHAKKYSKIKERRKNKHVYDKCILLLSS